MQSTIYENMVFLLIIKSFDFDELKMNFKNYYFFIEKEWKDRRGG